VEWDVEGPSGAMDHVAILVPDPALPGVRYPVLVALHGRGEAVKTPARGAMGWPEDYAMQKQIGRVAAPPLTVADFEGFVEPAHLAQLNADLVAHPYAGLIVVCPHVPDMNPNGSDVGAVARYIVERILPHVRAETPALATPESTAIDGVSMGGALALRIGLTNPDVFGAVGALQAAIGEEQAEELTELATAAIARRPSLVLRLVTSHEDYFHDAITHLSATWKSAHVPHDFADVPGPHDYAFNRGPGSLELLTWYGRVLRR
jgi:pimeloyl-ACP methyl ester carboxylesterase